MAVVAGSLFADRYVIQSCLGTGTFGEVYDAVDTHQDVVVALKVLKPLPLPVPPWQEAQILERLRSPYILAVRNADVWLGVRYLATDLATNDTAPMATPAHGAPPDQAVRWVRHASRGAARTHLAGLVHCDIKPENLFLTAAGEAVLGDFGIAALMNAAGTGPSRAGTPRTMAPEVAAGGPTSVRSDIYSLGATLYAVLAGRFAHDGPNGPAVMAAVVAGGPTPLRDVAPHVGQTLAQRVERAMARNPADRYPDAEAFDAALGQLPTPTRYWRRTDEHAAHTMCFRGERTGAADATVCAVPVGPRFKVEGRNWPSGRAIVRATTGLIAGSQLARRLRVAMAAV